jgi:hypothetical protein
MPLGITKTRRSISSLLMLSVLLIAGAGTLQASGPEKLVDSHEPLRLTLRVPVRELARKSASDVEFEGSITLEGGRKIPVTVAVFGKTRLDYCTIPPLALTPDPVAVSGTVFEGHKRLRIVTHCGHETESDRWVLLEYLTYRTYQILSDTALSVRLVEIEYRDPKEKTRKQAAYAFFVEDIEVAAQRRGLEWLEDQLLSPTHLDPTQMGVLALFQYMVGNTDWSVLRGAEGERCCHNAALLGDENASQRQLLPYDFDHSGLVNAPYARPSETLRLQNVRQRRYRGFCVHNDFLPAAIDLFNQRRALVETLFLDPSLRHPGPRQEALRYLETFYKEINNPKRLNKSLLRRCRRPNSK